MRFVILFFFAAAMGLAHADAPGAWEQPYEYDYDEFYMEDDFCDRCSEPTIVPQNNVTIIDNSVDINITNHVYIDVNRYPQAPSILPVPAPRLNGSYCFVTPQPWGWTIWLRAWDGWAWRDYALAHGHFHWQFQIARRDLYMSGQCPNP